MTDHPEPTRSVTIRVDGTEHTLAVEGRTLLSDALRHGAGLTGTHVACEQGACGACTVVLDGRAVRSCLMLAVQADGAEVATIEGVAPAGALHAVQEALRTNHGLQCGFCTPGIVMSLVAATHDGVDRRRGCRRGPRGPSLPMHRVRQHPGRHRRRLVSAGDRRPELGGPGMTWVGQRLPRFEDPRLLTGRGRFTDDIELPGLLHAAIVRSPVAHGTLLGLDTTEVDVPVAAVLGPSELLAMAQGRLPVVWHMPGEFQHDRPVVGDRVRFVGEPVGIVVAADRYRAEDAVDRILVEVDELPVGRRRPGRLEPGAPLLYDGRDDNVMCRFDVGDTAEHTDAVFAAAEETLSFRLDIGRVMGTPMEPRGIIAAPDADGRLTVWTSSQAPHAVRDGHRRDHRPAPAPHPGGRPGRRRRLRPEGPPLRGRDHGLPGGPPPGSSGEVDRGPLRDPRRHPPGPGRDRRRRRGLRP